MAQMIPAHLDPSHGNAAERAVYMALQNYLDRDLVVIHSLPWLDDRRNYLQQGECDFLVLHPRAGLLIIEVKSGTPRYDGQAGEWLYEDGLRIKDPFRQGQAASHYLNDLLARNCPGWETAVVPFGFAVAFPDAAAIQGALLPEMNVDLIFLEPQLPQIQRAVETALARFSPLAKPLSPQLMKDALAVLQPQFGLVPAMGPSLDEARRALVRLTEEQLRVLDGMQRNRRMFVCGGAGTGKTLLVCEQARRCARGGERALVLCFNNSLERELKALLDDVSDRVTVHTFHGLCCAMVEKAAGRVIFPSAGDDQQTFWNEHLPEQACDALDVFDARYDAILVDEAQDFHSGWWVPVEGLLADAKKSRLFLFGDDRQDLYQRAAELPFAEPVFDLVQNCRNTRAIARWVHGVAGLPEPANSERLPDGPAPIIIDVTDARSEADAVRKALHEVTHDHGIAAGDVVILGKHRLEKSSLAGHRKLGNFTVIGEGDDAVPNGVRYSTIHKFKGLEAEAVLLVGVGEPSSYYSEESERRFQYVGGSRARVLLYVFRHK